MSETKMTEKQQKLLEQDKLIAERMERKIARRERKLEKKRKLGILGVFVPFEDHIKSRQKASTYIIEDVAGDYGRAKNRVYKLKNEEYVLFKKFKNTNKAKRFMERNKK